MNKELLSLMNVGKAVLEDLNLLNIHTIAELKEKDPQELFDSLQRLNGKKQDPCVLDTFHAIIHEAKTGEKLPWWHWSRIRKGKGG